MRPEPYRFAARVVVAFAALAVVLAAADRAIAFAFGRGVRLVPPLPPAGQLPPRELFDVAAARGSVAVLGDSVVTYIPRDDSGPLSLFKLIAREVAPAPARDLSRGGRGMRMMAAQLEAMRRFDVRPAAAVLVLNLREFSPAYETNPYLQEAERPPMLETGWYLPFRAAAVFKYRFGTPSAEDFLDTEVLVEGVPAGTVRELDRPRAYFRTDDDAPPSIARTRSIARYAFDVDRSVHLPRLRDAVAGLAAVGVPVVAVAAPLDVEYLRRELTVAEMDAVRRNVEAVRTALTAPNARWIDLTETLASDQFDHPPLAPDEHVRSRGRALVAARVGEVLRSLLAH